MAHAALNFAVAFPALTTGWHGDSNTLVVLAVRDELALTAIAVEPAGRRLLRGVPKAFASDPSSDLCWEEVTENDL